MITRLLKGPVGSQLEFGADFCSIPTYRGWPSRSWHGRCWPPSRPSADSTSRAGSRQAVPGRIVDLNARSLLEIESLTIRSETGGDYTVEATGVVLGQFTPEHMVFGRVVVVAYHDDDCRLVLDSISD